MGRSSSSSSGSSSSGGSSGSSRQGRQGRRRSRSPLKRRDEAPATKLHVGKLSRNVNAEHLREIFGYFGKVTSAEVVMDRTVRQSHESCCARLTLRFLEQVELSKGFGYVEFDQHADAEAAVEHMDQAVIDGNTTPVKFSVAPSRRGSPSRGAQSRDAGQHRRRQSPPPRRRSPMPGRRCVCITA